LDNAVTAKQLLIYLIFIVSIIAVAGIIVFIFPMPLMASTNKIDQESSGNMDNAEFPKSPSNEKPPLHFGPLSISAAEIPEGTRPIEIERDFLDSQTCDIHSQSQLQTSEALETNPVGYNPQIDTKITREVTHIPRNQLTGIPSEILTITDFEFVGNVQNFDEAKIHFVTDTNHDFEEERMEQFYASAFILQKLLDKGKKVTLFVEDAFETARKNNMTNIRKNYLDFLGLNENQLKNLEIPPVDRDICPENLHQSYNDLYKIPTFNDDANQNLEECLDCIITKRNQLLIDPLEQAIKDGRTVIFRYGSLHFNSGYSEPFRGILDKYSYITYLDPADLNFTLNKEQTNKLFFAERKSDVALSQNNYTEAIKYASLGLSIFERTGLRLNRAEAWFYLGKYDKAMEDISIIIERSPNFVSAFVVKARIHYIMLEMLSLDAQKKQRLTEKKKTEMEFHMTEFKKTVPKFQEYERLYDLRIPFYSNPNYFYKSALQFYKPKTTKNLPNAT